MRTIFNEIMKNLKLQSKKPNHLAIHPYKCHSLINFFFQKKDVNFCTVFPLSHIRQWNHIKIYRDAGKYKLYFAGLSELICNL